MRAAQRGQKIVTARSVAGPDLRIGVGEAGVEIFKIASWFGHVCPCRNAYLARVKSIMSLKPPSRRQI